jgi:hypothetical protein
MYGSVKHASFSCQSINYSGGKFYEIGRIMLTHQSMAPKYTNPILFRKVNAIKRCTAVTYLGEKANVF